MYITYEYVCISYVVVVRIIWRYSRQECEDIRVTCRYSLVFNLHCSYVLSYCNSRARNRMPRRSTRDQMPRRSARDQMPRRSVRDQMPRRTALDQMPRRSARDQMPRLSASDRMLRRSACKRIYHDAMHAIARHEALHAIACHVLVCSSCSAALFQKEGKVMKLSAPKKIIFNSCVFASTQIFCFELESIIIIQ